MEKISIIVPCYNEQEILEIFYEELIKIIKQIENNYFYEIVFIDDGSKDKTLEKLKKLREKDENIKIISFSRNFGKESAIYAGLSNSTGELIVLMDSDLQHPPKTILEMLEEINNGYDVVATKRINRKRRTNSKKHVFKYVL